MVLSISNVLLESLSRAGYRCCQEAVIHFPMPDPAAHEEDDSACSCAGTPIAHMPFASAGRGVITAAQVPLRPQSRDLRPVNEHYAAM